jgi:hypothetical protein
MVEPKAQQQLIVRIDAIALTYLSRPTWPAIEKRTKPVPSTTHEHQVAATIHGQPVNPGQRCPGNFAPASSGETWPVAMVYLDGVVYIMVTGEVLKLGKPHGQEM